LLFGLLIGSTPALATQIAGTKPIANNTIVTSHVVSVVRTQSTVVGGTAHSTVVGYPQGGRYPTIYNGNGVAPGYAYNPYGNQYAYGTPYGYNGSPYGYTQPYGYGTAPYGYGTAPCVNGAGYAYPGQTSATAMLIAPALGALAASLGGTSPAAALLTGLTSASTACAAVAQPGASPYGYAAPVAYGTPYGTSPYGTSPYGASPYGTSPYGTSPYGYANSPCVNGVSPYATGYPNSTGYQYPAQNTSQMLLMPVLGAVAASLGGQSPAAAALLSGLLSASATTACPSVAYGGYPTTYPGYNYQNYQAYQPYGYAQQPYAYNYGTTQPIVNNYYNVTRVVRVYRRNPVARPIPVLAPVPHIAAFAPAPHVAIVRPHVGTFVPVAHVATFVHPAHVATFVRPAHVATFVHPAHVATVVHPAHVGAFAPAHVAKFATAPRVARPVGLATTVKPATMPAMNKQLAVVRPAVSLNRTAPINVSINRPATMVDRESAAVPVRNNDDYVPPARSEEARVANPATDRYAAPPAVRAPLPEDVNRPADAYRPPMARPAFAARNDYAAPAYHRPAAAYAAPAPRAFAERSFQRAPGAGYAARQGGAPGGGGGRGGHHRDQ
jgi:hypothetical protein